MLILLTGGNTGAYSSSPDNLADRYSEYFAPMPAIPVYSTAHIGVSELLDQLVAST